MFQQLYTYINILHVLLHVYYFIYEHSFKQVFIPTVQMIEPKITHIKCLVCSINAISLTPCLQPSTTKSCFPKLHM